MFFKAKELLARFREGDAKSKELVKNIALSFGVKGLAILVSLINMPIFMGYFENSAILGVWFTLLSMLNWILTFDLGIGNGLRNYLVIALERNDEKECRHLISSAYCSIFILILVLSSVAFVMIPKADWNAVCNIDRGAISQSALVSAIQLLSIGVLIQFLLKIITSILYAMQKPAVPNFLLLISNVLLLASTFVLNSGDPQKNLLRLAAAYVLTANLPMLVTTIIVFLKPLRNIGIHPSFWTATHTKQILGLGLDFLALQLLSMACFNTREFYIMRFLGPEEVVPYQIYNRLFSLVSTFFVLAMTPMWSAITQAYAQKDTAWIKATYKNTKKLLWLFTFGSVLVVLLSQVFVNIWLGSRRIEMSLPFGVLFALFNIEYMWINLHSQFENGLKRLRAQKIGYLFAAIAFPLLSFGVAKYTHSWIAIVASNIASLLPLCVFQFFYMKQYFKSTSLEV